MTTLPIKPKEREMQNFLPSEASIRINNLFKKYQILNINAQKPFAPKEEFFALKQISFEVLKGSIFGIIGRNGAGKTTLLNIIAGILTPSEGDVFVSGKVLGLFNLGVGFQDQLSGRENIFLNGSILGASKKFLKEKEEAVIDFSELGRFIDMPLGTYSQGMRLRLGFAIIANLDFDILVIDEVLAVGDTVFQDKCFKRLVDYKQQGKTLVITNQSLDLIKRLCDNAALIDRGKLLYWGKTEEALNKYKVLLNTEKFSVWPEDSHPVGLVEDTKKWADEPAYWGKSFGTKEVEIERVVFINRFGFSSKRIRTNDPLKIKASFRARNRIKEPHFGVAIFRHDGVYCYGPNTLFDGHKIPQLREGKGYFVLEYPKLPLAEGKYYLSVAIWDEGEKIPFDYHNAVYELQVSSRKKRSGSLLDLPFKVTPKNAKHFKDKYFCEPEYLKNSQPACSSEIDNFGRLRMMDAKNEEKDIFFTGEKAIFDFSCWLNQLKMKEFLFWIGIFRDDGVLCQGVKLNLKKQIKIIFPRFSLLPGKYFICWGLLPKTEGGQKGLYFNGIPFRMVSKHRDHGTVFIEHRWRWRMR